MHSCVEKRAVLGWHMRMAWPISQFESVRHNGPLDATQTLWLCIFDPLSHQNPQSYRMEHHAPHAQTIFEDHVNPIMPSYGAAGLHVPSGHGNLTTMTRSPGHDLSAKALRTSCLVFLRELQMSSAESITQHGA